MKLKLKHKLKPYTKKITFKYEAEPNKAVMITSKLAKLVAKNANRSLKKGKRQQLKNELNNILNE